MCDTYTLDEDQKRIIDEIATSSGNIFLTGSAGTSKSVITKHVINVLQNENVVFRVTAPTGIAAANIGGQTLHSLAKLGLASESAEVLLARILRKNKNLVKLWNTLEVLIIDEISMVDLEFFEKLNYIVSNIRCRFDAAFGGIRLILVGDFFQLKPVNQHNGYEYLFEMPLWNLMNLRVINLTRVYRQDNKEFVSLLQRVRIGEITEDDKEYIQSLTKGLEMEDETIKPTILMPLNKEVAEINEYFLANINEEEKVFKGQSGYFVDQETCQPNDLNMSPDMIKEMQANMVTNNIVGASVSLKASAQIMLTANIKLHSNDLIKEYQFYNGSRGIVDSFDDLGNPVVRFFDTGNLLFKIIPYCWNASLSGYKETITFTQIPLKLAWACSIHKSQGLTISPLKISLGASLFTAGQAYVALSRARNPKTLQITSYARNKPFIVSKKVKQFYAAL